MFKNGLYNLVGTGIRIGLGIISVPMLVGLLGVEKYGIYSILISIIGFAVLSEWSISLTITVFLAQDIAMNSQDSESSLNDTLLVSLWSILALSTLTTVLLWYVAPLLPSLLNGLSNADEKIIITGCRLSSLTVWARLFQQYYIGIEQANNRYAILNIINTIFALTQTILILLVAWLFKSILPILLVQAMVSVAFVIVHAVVCRRLGFFHDFSLIHSINRKRAWEIITYSSRTWLGTIGGSLFSQGDRLIVGSMLNIDTVGIYAALTSIVNQINVLSAIPAQPLVSLISKIRTETSIDSQDWLAKQSLIISSIRKALLVNVFIAIGMGLFITLFAPEITSLLFRSSAKVPRETSWYLVILTFVYTIYSFNAVGYFILFAVKQEIVNMLTTLTCGIITLLFIAFLTYHYGLIGSIIGNSPYLLSLFLLYKGINSVKIPWKSVFDIMRTPILLFLITPILVIALQSLLLKCIAIFILIAFLCVFGLNKFKENIYS